MLFKRITWLAVVLMLLSACENNIATVNLVTATAYQNLPIESGKNIQIIYSDSAQAKALLNAPLLDRYAGKKPFFLLPKGMKIIFYTDNSKAQTTLVADYGIGFDSGNGMERMEAKRNVVVINEKGEKLNSEHLIWDARTKKIYTPEFVKITTKDEVIWGDGFQANEDFSAYEIKNVKGQIDIKDEAQ
jgi:LPS export ABC transporter protein LptC